MEKKESKFNRNFFSIIVGFRIFQMKFFFSSFKQKNFDYFFRFSYASFYRFDYYYREKATFLTYLLLTRFVRSYIHSSSFFLCYLINSFIIICVSYPKNFLHFGFWINNSAQTIRHNEKNRNKRM